MAQTMTRLRVGDTAPAFALRRGDGQEIRLTDVLSAGAAIIVFIRGTWWPNCRRQLEQLQTHLPTYRTLGAEVLVIVGQHAEKVADYHRARSLALPILVDPDRTVIKRYGVYHRLGLTAFNIARPATFIVDREQRIRFVYISKGQADRPDHERLVAELQQLRPRPPASPPPAAGASPVEPVPQ
jgi:thioredoxin-dependent peroxiredoxin